MYNHRVHSKRRKNGRWRDVCTWYFDFVYEHDSVQQIVGKRYSEYGDQPTRI